MCEILVFLVMMCVCPIQGDGSVSRAKGLSVHLITLLADSSDWLSLFHQSGSSMEDENSSGVLRNSVTLHTLNINIHHVMTVSFIPRRAQFIQESCFYGYYEHMFPSDAICIVQVRWQVFRI